MPPTKPTNTRKRKDNTKHNWTNIQLYWNFDLFSTYLKLQNLASQEHLIGSGVFAWRNFEEAQI